ncbi:uncharacterized protein AC631_01534 [Debaryomyces fabryi]|uniref:NADP-dependent oxidoreductase domain-containing protein n=1 Tax=Debaryomyces fabryi TaxID=58627 RepID=A0A0V1Q2H9_9ASCO|nr:uncharacterized protein AC631_01534 [Debaryomyces fabryi]KSA02734.1 hypothetical protein AC631_01534 [Debaryomyces fabryi]CUM56954.1 unnamed protein product [Debaryomyces fabryi]
MSPTTNYQAIKLEDKFGYGTMSLTWTPNPPPFEQSIETIKYVTTSDIGTKLLNGGEFYGFQDKELNLKLLKQFLESSDPKLTKDLIISIKGGLQANLVPDGSKEGISKSIENIISYFPQDKTSRPTLIFEAARVDPKVPIEETVSYIAEYVKQGKIDGISLSEVGAQSIVKASNVFPISCVEVEFSLLCQDIINNGVLEECSKRNIPIIAYSPICRGFLTDYTVEREDTFLSLLDKNDIRTHVDKFSPENFKHNMVLVKELHKFAHTKKNTSLESLSLSWILKISELKNFEGISEVTKILPIPSGSTKERINKNFGQIVELTDDDLAEIQQICKSHEVKGYRYTKELDFMNFA